MKGFNPLPPLPAGDTTCNWRQANLSKVSIRSRRCRREIPGAALCVTTRQSCFNPLPPLPAGDTPRGWAWVDPLKVSIRSRRCRREILSAERLRIPANACFNPLPPLPAGDTVRFLDGLTPYSSFNPLPPLPAGDTKISSSMSRRATVSIRSRRCRREIHSSSWW